MIRLTLHDGAQRHLLVLDQLPARIGRSPECEVRLPAAPTVSRVHAVITATAQGLQVSDAGSRNGTFVNGERITAGVPFTVVDRVRVGPYVIAMEGDDQAETVEAGGPDTSRLRVETGLSARELEVLALVAGGCTDQQVAERLVLSVKTVRSHLDRIRDKTGCRRRPELARFAFEHGIA